MINNTTHTDLLPSPVADSLQQKSSRADFSLSWTILIAFYQVALKGAFFDESSSSSDKGTGCTKSSSQPNGTAVLYKRLDSSASSHRSSHGNGEADACIEARPQLFEDAANNFRAVGMSLNVSRSSSIVVERSTHSTVNSLRGLWTVSFESEGLSCSSTVASCILPCNAACCYAMASRFVDGVEQAVV